MPVSYPGDSDYDRDVDGLDLSAFAHQVLGGENEITVEDFGEWFGR